MAINILENNILDLYTINLKGRHLLALKDFTQGEIEYLLYLAADLKKAKRAGYEKKTLEGKNIALIFEKTSTRTRCAFEVAAFDQGANVTFLDCSNSQMGKKESMEDTAKILGRFYDAIEFRGYNQETVEILAEHSGSIVWNGLTDKFHPTQILADFLTIKEHINEDLSKVKLAYMGDGRNNMGNSLMFGAAIMGMDFRIIAPNSLFPDESLIKEAKEIAKLSGAKLTFTDNKKEGLKGADAVYTDVWVSMGEEDRFEERIGMLLDYQVNMDALKLTDNPGVKFMHCLPAYHDTNTKIGQEIYEKYGLKEMEVTDEVFRSKYSIVFDEAENRLHTIKAAMVATLG